MNKNVKSFGMVSVGALCAVALLTGCSKSNPVIEVPSIQEEGEMSSTSPMGVRKFMNLNGLRYEFKNDGETVSLSTSDLGEKIGVLETAINVGDEFMVEGDFFTTFALNGEVYELNNYRSDFRVAVQLDGQYYIAESVGTIEAEQMNVLSYLEATELSSKVAKAEIMDHFETDVLKTLSKEEAVRMVEEISDATVMTLTGESFEQIAQAQSNGESYLVKFIFEDGSETKMYMIPSLNYVSIGDYTCTDATLNENIGDLFNGLQ